MRDTQSETLITKFISRLKYTNKGAPNRASITAVWEGGGWGVRRPEVTGVMEDKPRCEDNISAAAHRASGRTAVQVTRAQRARAGL